MNVMPVYNNKQNTSFGVKFDKEFKGIAEKVADLGLCERIKTLGGLDDTVKVFCYGIQDKNKINYYYPTYGKKVILPPGYLPTANDKYLNVSLNNGTSLEVYGKTVKDMLKATLDHIEELPEVLRGKQAKAKELVA